MALSAEARALVASINKQHGAGSILVGSDIRRTPPFTSGSLSVDSMLAGGFPANQWTEIIGKQSAGKTSFVHKVVAANQQKNPDFNTFWVAAEGYEPEWAAALGVDVSRVAVCRRQAMEEAYEAILAALESRAFDCIVLDSYPALIPDEEDQKGMDGATVSVGAKLTNKLFRKAGKAGLRSPEENERPYFGLFINQWRTQIGGWAPHGITPTFTPGGMGKDYAFYVRLELRVKEELTVPAPGGLKKRVGHAIAFKTIKSKVSSPGQAMSVDFYTEDTDSFRCGDYDTAKETMALGLYHEVIGRRGSGYVICDEFFRSKDALLEAIRSNEDIKKTLREGVLSAVGGFSG